MAVEADDTDRHWAGERTGALRGLIRAIALWIGKRRTRRGLAELTPDQLRDIGLTRQAARAEVRKSWFWD